MTRVVAVCGYSDGRETGLHAICERRLRLAEREAGPDDVVLLTGWARHADATAEAELMAQSWAGSSRELHVDSSARSTFGERGRGGEARGGGRRDRGGARHVRLARAAVPARCSGPSWQGSGRSVVVAATDEPASRAARLRELACWLGVPFAALRRG